MSEPTADEIARWAEMHHGWTPEDYPDSGEFCVECGEHMPCPTTRLLALVAAQAEQIARVRAVLDHSALVSPSPAMTVYAADIRAALDGDAP